MRAILIAAAAGFLLAPAAFAETKTVMGEVVGLNCYMASGGKPDAECTKATLQAGEPAGIVEQGTGELYIVVSTDNSTNAAMALAPNSAQCVEVKGEVREREGIRTITVAQLRVVDPSSSARAQAPSLPTARTR